MDVLWTAFDITTLYTNVQSALTVGVTLGLMFVGYGLIRKTGNKVSR